jgi:hypothetical protein
VRKWHDARNTGLRDKAETILHQELRRDELQGRNAGRWKGPECKIGMKNPGTRRQLRLEIERTSEELDRKAFGLEFVKRATDCPAGCGK